MAVSRVDVEVLETRLLYSADLLPFGDDVADDNDVARVFPAAVGDGSTVEQSYTVAANGVIVVSEFQAESGLDRWVLLDAPTQGTVELNGSAVNIGDTVTGTQVQNGEVSYVSTVGGGTATSDSVRFQQADGTGTYDNYVRWNLRINHAPNVQDDVVLLTSGPASTATSTLLSNDSDQNGDTLAITGFSSPSSGDLELSSANTLSYNYTASSDPFSTNLQDTATVDVREIDASYVFALPLITSEQELVNNITPSDGSMTLSNNGEGASFTSSNNGPDYGAFDFPDAFRVDVEFLPTDIDDGDNDLIWSVGAAADPGSITMYIDQLDDNKNYLIAHMGNSGDLPDTKAELTGGPHLFFELKSSFAENVWHSASLVVDTAGMAHLYVDGNLERSLDVSGTDFQGGDFRVGNDIYNPNIFTYFTRPFDGQIRNLYVRDLAGHGTTDPVVNTLTSTIFFRHYEDSASGASGDSYVVDPDLISVDSSVLGTAPLSDNDTFTTSPTVTHTWSLVTDGAVGTATVNGDGSFSYIQNTATNTNDSFTYQLSSAYRATAGGAVLWTDTSTATVALDASGVVIGSRPVAVDDAITVDEGDSALLTATLNNSLLSNDTDGDGTLSVVSNTNPSFGTLTLNANGTFSYTHDGSENFSDSFTYVLQDADGDQALAPGTVNITINPLNENAPNAVTETLSVAYAGTQTVLDGGATSVLANDSDVDTGDTLRAELVLQATKGTVVLNGNGTFVYTHDGALGGGTDQFTYRVLDAADNATWMTVTINITANGEPVGQADEISVDEGGTQTELDMVFAGTPPPGAGTSVLENDSDPDGDTITAVLHTAPAHGTLTLNANGTFSYTHDGSENFSDAFRYSATDQHGLAESSETVVSITINPVNDNDPIANDDLIRVDHGASRAVLVGGVTSVLANDSDLDTGDTLIAELVQGPGKGTLTLNADGTFQYQHDGVSEGNDFFRYQARDAAGNTTIARVGIQVAPPDNPPQFLGGDQQVLVNAGVPDQADLGAQFSDEGPMTFEIDKGAEPFFSIDPNTGELTINATASDVGNHRFSVKVTDTADQSITKVYRIVVLESDTGGTEPGAPGSSPDTPPDTGGGDTTDPDGETSNAPGGEGEGEDAADTGEGGDTALPEDAAGEGALNTLAEGFAALWGGGAEVGAVATGATADAVSAVDVNVLTFEAGAGTDRAIGFAGSPVSVSSIAGLAGLSLNNILDNTDNPSTGALVDWRRIGPSSVNGVESQLEVTPAVTTATAATGFSLGYLLWLARSGFLLSTVLSALPAWRNIDPLPVLNSVAGSQDGRDEDDDKSLNELTEGK
ncbi:MAG: Ig-like domain-containing protein [Pseudomonadota bacterium]